MPILDLQRRLRELGRIRIGIQVPAKEEGKTRPEKLDRFRVTSASQPLIERVAQLYGGHAQPWDNHGSPQFEVITTATRLPILLPPQPVSQYYELWSGGGCQRRCDGQTELLKDRPCLCSPDPTERKCKPTTRLNVILRDVEGIGVWRLESHGYYSAIELPDVAAFVSRAGSYVSAWLSLEQRSALRDGKTLRWVVPTIEVEVTPAALLAGNAPAGELMPPPAREIEGAPPALVDPPAPRFEEMTAEEITMARMQIGDAVTLEQLRDIWDRFTGAFEMPFELRRSFEARANELRKHDQEQAVGVDALWLEVMSAAPEDWSTAKVEEHFTQTTGVAVAAMTAADVRRYLDTVYPTTAAE